MKKDIVGTHYKCHFEALLRGAHNNVFSWRKMKNIHVDKPLILSYEICCGHVNHYSKAILHSTCAYTTHFHDEYDKCPKI